MRALAFVALSILIALQAHAGPLEDGRALLFSGDVIGADDAFAQAIASPPTSDDMQAHAFRSISRVLRAAQGGEAGSDPNRVDSVTELLDGFAYSAAGRLLLHWTSSPPHDAENHVALPPNSPTGGDVVHVADVALLSAISGALDDLAALDPSFSMTVSAAEVQQFAVAFGDVSALLGADLHVDYADARLYQSALGAAAATILVSLAYDVDFDIDQLATPHVAHDIQQILDADPSLLTLEPDAEAQLEAARQEALAAIAAYLDASDRIRTQAPGEGLFHLQPDRVDREALWRARLLEITASLSGCFELPVFSYGFKPCNWLGTGSRTAPNPRALLPMFEYDAAFEPPNSARVDTLVDPTFGGVLVGASPSDLVGISKHLLRLPNDRWQEAIEIGNGLVTGTLDGATQDGNSSHDYDYDYLYDPKTGTVRLVPYWFRAPSKDVWYRYTAVSETTLRISCSDAGYASISVHTDGPGVLANEIGAVSAYPSDLFTRHCFYNYGPNNDGRPLALPLSAGQSVLIRVSAPLYFCQSYYCGDWSYQAPDDFAFLVPEPNLAGLALTAIATLACVARRRWN